MPNTVARAHARQHGSSVGTLPRVVKRLSEFQRGGSIGGDLGDLRVGRAGVRIVASGTESQFPLGTRSALAILRKGADIRRPTERGIEPHEQGMPIMIGSRAITLLLLVNLMFTVHEQATAQVRYGDVRVDGQGDENGDPGIGVTRIQMQSAFENAQFTFEAPTVEEGQISVIGTSIDESAIVVLIGPPENLIQAKLILINFGDSALTEKHAMSYALFLELAFPEPLQREAVNSWVAENQWDLSRGVPGSSDNIRKTIGHRDVLAGTGTIQGAPYATLSVQTIH